MDTILEERSEDKNFVVSCSTDTPGYLPIIPIFAFPYVISKGRECLGAGGRMGGLGPLRAL
jgi:hypothetical protein